MRHIEAMADAVNALPIQGTPVIKEQLTGAIAKDAVGVLIYYHDNMCAAYVAAPKHPRDHLWKAPYNFYSFLPCPTLGQALDVKTLLETDYEPLDRGTGRNSHAFGRRRKS
jgi:hypothetical protein